MYIFNNLPGANGYNLSFSEELWLASLLRFFIEDLENEGMSTDDIDYLDGTRVDADKLRASLDKHILLYSDVKPNVWYDRPIPEALLTPPNFHIRLLVEFKRSEGLGFYCRLMWPSHEGKWYYTAEDSNCIPVDLTSDRVNRWMIVFD